MKLTWSPALFGWHYRLETDLKVEERFLFHIYDETYYAYQDKEVTIVLVKTGVEWDLRLFERKTGNHFMVTHPDLSTVFYCLELEMINRKTKITNNVIRHASALSYLEERLNYLKAEES